MRSGPGEETPEKSANGKPSYAINEEDGKPVYVGHVGAQSTAHT